MANEVSTMFVAISARGAVSGAKKVVGAIRSMGGAARNANGTMKGFGSTMKRVFMLGGGILLLKKLTSTLTSFEDAMGQLQGVTRATAAEMRQFSETARELGATTRFTAGEAAGALVALSRAGFAVEESIAAVRSTLDLATGQMLQLEEATQFVASSIRQFGLNADQAERVADVLTNTANSAATDVRQLAGALSFGGVAARAVGVSLEETAAIMGVLSDNAIRGTRAGMGVRSMMTRLVAPTTQAQAAIKKLGLSLDEVNPQKTGITKALQNLKDANIDVTEAVAIFGQRQFVAALAAVKNIEKIKELTAANNAAAGSSRIAASIMEDTLSGAFKELKSAIEEATLSAGDSGFLGVLKEVTRFMTDVVRGLSGIKTSASETFKDLNLAVIRVGWGFGKFFAGIKAGFNLIWETVKNIGRGIQGIFGLAINATISAIKGLVAGFGSALNAMLLQGAAIARYFDKDLNQALRDTAGSVRATRLEMNTLFSGLKVPEPEFRKLKDIWDETAETIKADIDAIDAAYVTQRQKIIKNWNEQQRVKQEVENTKKAIEDAKAATDRATEAASGLKNMWTLVSGGVTDVTSKVLTSVTNMGRTAGAAIKNVASQIGGAKKKADGFKVTMEDITGASLSAFTGLVKGTKNFEDAILDATDAIIDMAIRMAVMSAFAPAGPSVTPKVTGARGLVAMASGGITRGPTAALIGERGPEAVVPLQRDERGVLGLGGGGGRGDSNVTFNIISPDKRGVEDSLLRNPKLIQQMNQTYRQGYALG